MDIPHGVPEHLREEYLKMLKDEKKYSRMYPIAYGILKSYTKESHGKEED